MSLTSKIGAARELIESAIADTPTHAAVMSSFGKDSMVMLDVIKRAGLRFPIVSHREPFKPLKYRFSNEVIEANGYVVYDYPPVQTAITKRGPHMEILGMYRTGGKVNMLPTGIRAPEEGSDFLCGLVDLYNKPLGDFVFPWGLIFIGHKSSDVDPMLGSVPLNTQVVDQEGAGPTLVFPLAEFTDADIWEYTRRYKVPVNTKRYDMQNEGREFDDITYNPDFFHACTLCIDRDAPKEVFCPKVDHMVMNISGQVRYVEPPRPDYIGEPNAGS